MAAVVTACFLVFIYGIPIGQAVLEQVKGEDSTLLPLFQRAPTRENLRQFEKDIEAGSYAKEFFQPRVQLALTRFGRVGNKLAVVGHDRGWLFYTPGLTYLSGPSFLDRDVIRAREKEALDGGQPVHADPRPAIFDFAAMLAARGIKLFLFPMPDKTMLQPMQLHGRSSGAELSPVPKNPGLDALVTEVRSRGVEVFEPSPKELPPAQKPLFLAQDTHYTPAWMEEIAARLASAIKRTVTLSPPATPFQFRAVPQSVERVGDLVDMLKLPDEQTFFVPQSAAIHRVENAAGEPWEPDPESEVLLLGDSFTNVFSLDSMGWGEAAGLAPHLALSLGQSIDVIAQNDAGAFATRQALARALAGGEDRLKGKRVVVWEFASRELAVGDWKPIDWAEAARGVH
jgi:alginate O-acetyltransferase complex protein AlgJ